jgi:hypothetical protein
MYNAMEFLPGTRFQPSDRRNEYDVTNTVRVSSVAAVRDAVQKHYREAFPAAAFDVLWLAFHDFEQLFAGRLPGFQGCDTVYHDRQHTLDMTLAMARLLLGYERSCAEADRLGPDRVAMGIVVALFHDAGYIRRSSETPRANGAEFTTWHVSRSADFLRGYLPRIGMTRWIGVATRIVHFTGYELNIDDIELDDPKDSLIGHFLGTADLMAQMADRCYLEKCRDRLYSEFVLAGVAFTDKDEHTRRGGDVAYASGIDLLRKTPEFYDHMAMSRLDDKFNRAYRYIEVLYDGRNPYFEFIERNLEHLQRVIEANDWKRLRRQPPCFTVLEHPLKSVSALVSRRLADLNAPASALSIGVAVD